MLLIRAAVPAAQDDRTVLPTPTRRLSCRWCQPRRVLLTPFCTLACRWRRPRRTLPPPRPPPTPPCVSVRQPRRALLTPFCLSTPGPLVPLMPQLELSAAARSLIRTTCPRPRIPIARPRARATDSHWRCLPPRLACTHAGASTRMHA